MTQRKLAFIAWWLLWAVTSVPTIAFSLFVFREPPFWPHFSEEATLHGTAVWAAMAFWTYATPLILLASRNWWLADTEDKNAQNR